MVEKRNFFFFQIPVESLTNYSGHVYNARLTLATSSYITMSATTCPRPREKTITLRVVFKKFYSRGENLINPEKPIFYILYANSKWNIVSQYRTFQLNPHVSSCRSQKRTRKPPDFFPIDFSHTSYWKFPPIR